MGLPAEFYRNEHHEDCYPSEVEDCILNRQIDPDGWSNWDWVHCIGEDVDLMEKLIVHILLHKDDQMIKPMYQEIRNLIEGVLDRC